MADTLQQDYPRAVTENDATTNASEPMTDRATMARLLARGVWMALLTAAVLFAGYKGQQALIASKEEPAKRPAREKVAFVKTVPVAFGTYQPMLRLYGETVAGRRVELRALVAGDVKSVGDGLRDGGEVKAGDPLLTINPFNFRGAVVETKAELAVARGRLDELKATAEAERGGLKRDKEQLAIAIKDVQRTASLVRRNAVSARLLDERELTQSQRKQAVELRESNIKVQAARIVQQEATITRLTWALDQAKQRLADTKLVAPFNAYINDVNAEVGRLLGASDRVATLFDKDWIEATFVLTDQQYGRLIAASNKSGTQLIGRPVKVIWRIGSDPITYDAKIVRVGATIAAGQGGVTMIARINDPTSPVAIRPGAFVEVSSADRVYRDVARVPQTAIYNNNTVYVVRDGRLEVRDITVIGTDNGFSLIQGAELKAGERVVKTRLSTIGAGLKVEEL